MTKKNRTTLWTNETKVCACYWKCNPPLALFSWPHWAETMARRAYLTWVQIPPPSRLCWTSGDWWACTEQNASTWLLRGCLNCTKLSVWLQSVSVSKSSFSSALWTVPGMGNSCKSDLGTETWVLNVQDKKERGTSQTEAGVMHSQTSSFPPQSISVLSHRVSHRITDTPVNTSVIPRNDAGHPNILSCFLLASWKARCAVVNCTCADLGVQCLAQLKSWDLCCWWSYWHCHHHHHHRPINFCSITGRIPWPSRKDAWEPNQALNVSKINVCQANKRVYSKSTGISIVIIFLKNLASANLFNRLYEQTNKWQVFGVPEKLYDHGATD